MGRKTKHPNRSVATVVQTVSPATLKSSQIGVSGVKNISEQPVCWEFVLQDVTPVGRIVKRDTPIEGVRDGDRIMVLSEDGALGYAPADKSILLLQALTKENLLRGQILNNQNSEVTAQLCIK